MFRFNECPDQDDGRDLGARIETAIYTQAVQRGDTRSAGQALALMLGYFLSEGSGQ